MTDPGLVRCGVAHCDWSAPSTVDCPDCRGAGEVRRLFRRSRPCRTCRGTGRIAGVAARRTHLLLHTIDELKGGGRR